MVMAIVDYELPVEEVYDDDDGLLGFAVTGGHYKEAMVMALRRVINGKQFGSAQFAEQLRALPDEAFVRQIKYATNWEKLGLVTFVYYDGLCDEVALMCRMPVVR